MAPARYLQAVGRESRERRERRGRRGVAQVFVAAVCPHRVQESAVDVLADSFQYADAHGAGGGGSRRVLAGGGQGGPYALRVRRRGRQGEKGRRQRGGQQRPPAAARGRGWWTTTGDAGSGDRLTVPVCRLLWQQALHPVSFLFFFSQGTDADRVGPLTSQRPSHRDEIPPLWGHQHDCSPSAAGGLLIPRELGFLPLAFPLPNQASYTCW